MDHKTGPAQGFIPLKGTFNRMKLLKVTVFPATIHDIVMKYAGQINLQNVTMLQYKEHNRSRICKFWDSDPDLG